MAVRTMDELIAAGQDPWVWGPRNVFISGTGVAFDFWSNAGGSFDSTLAGVTLDSADSGGNIAGQLFPFINPTPSPDSAETFLNRFTFCQGNQPGIVCLYDRLWHNGGFTITSTSAQTVNSPTWPARDVNGSSNGAGVQVGLYVQSATGAASPNITLTYTNSDGTASRSSVINGSASWAAGWLVPFPLQEDDKGIRSVQSLQLSASWVSGTINLVAYRPIIMLECANTGSGMETDFTINGMPQLWNGTVPCVYVRTTSAATTYLYTASMSVFQG